MTLAENRQMYYKMCIFTQFLAFSANVAEKHTSEDDEMLKKVPVLQGLIHLVQ